MSEEIQLGDPIDFYDGAITLRFDKENHAYHLMLPDGTSEIQEGVTTISNILDHSMYLMPWAVKMMYLKLLKTMPRETVNGTEYTLSILWTELDKILQEAKGAHREKFEDAGDIGHMAHSWIEDSIRIAIAKNDGIVEKMHPAAPEDERAVNCGLAAFKWMQAHNVRWISTERKVYSRQHKYAGTMDGLATVDSCDDPSCCHRFFMDELSVIDWKSSNHLRIEYLYQTAAYQAAYQEEFGVDIRSRWILRLGKEDGEFEAWYETDFETDFVTFRACLTLYRYNKMVDKRMRDLKKLKTFRKREAKKAATPPKAPRKKKGE
jgi:hypothetical protein